MENFEEAREEEKSTVLTQFRTSRTKALEGAGKKEEVNAADGASNESIVLEKGLSRHKRLEAHYHTGIVFIRLHSYFCFSRRAYLVLKYHPESNLKREARIEWFWRQQDYLDDIPPMGSIKLSSNTIVESNERTIAIRNADTREAVFFSVPLHAPSLQTWAFHIVALQHSFENTGIEHRSSLRNADSLLLMKQKSAGKEIDNEKTEAVLKLQQLGKKLNWRRLSISYAIRKAVLTGDESSVRGYLQQRGVKRILLNEARPLVLAVSAVREKEVGIIRVIFESFPYLGPNSRNRLNTPLFHFCFIPPINREIHLKDINILWRSNDPIPFKSPMTSEEIREKTMNMLYFMVECGADISLRGHHGAGPLSMITMWSHYTCPSNFPIAEIINFVLKQDPDSIRYHNDDNMNLFHYLFAFTGNYTENVVRIFNCLDDDVICELLQSKGDFLRMNHFLAWHVGKGYCKELNNIWRERELLPYLRRATPLTIALCMGHLKTARILLGLTSEPISVNLRQIHLSDASYFPLISKTFPVLLEEIFASFEEVPYNANNSRTILQQKIFFPDPDKVQVYSSPLAVLAGCPHMGIWCTVAAKQFITLKWDLYGRRYFWHQAGPFLLLLIQIAGVGFSIPNSNPHKVFTYSAAGISIYLFCCEELPELWNTGVREYINSVYNYFSCGAYLSQILLAVLNDAYADISSIIYTAGTLCAFARLMEFLSIIKATSQFVHLLWLFTRIVSRWFILFIIFEFTFILIFYSMLRECETGGQFDTPFNAMMSIFAISMGELNLPIIDTATFDDDDSNCSRNKEYIASLLVLVLVFILTICYLNLLIAMMTQSYTDAHRESTQLAYHSIAKALFTWESTMSKTERKKYFDQMNLGKAADDVSFDVRRGLLGRKAFGAILSPDEIIVAQKRSRANESEGLALEYQSLRLDDALDLPSLVGPTASDRTRLISLRHSLERLEKSISKLHKLENTEKTQRRLVARRPQYKAPLRMLRE